MENGRHEVVDDTRHPMAGVGNGLWGADPCRPSPLTTPRASGPSSVTGSPPAGRDTSAPAYLAPTQEITLPSVHRVLLLLRQRKSIAELSTFDRTIAYMALQRLPVPLCTHAKVLLASDKRRRSRDLKPYMSPYTS